MRLRFVLLLALSSVACSSEEPAPAPTGPNQCVASGALCAENFPFLCSPGFIEVTAEPRKSACGMSKGEDSQPVKCCVRNPVQPDTGVADTATADAASDGATDGSTTDGATTDAASTDAASTDAASTDAASTDVGMTDGATGG